MTEEHRPILELNLGENGGHLKFSQLDDVRKWLNTERQAFSWLLNTTPESGVQQTIQNDYQNTFQQLENELSNLGRFESSGELVNRTGDLSRAIQGAYGTARLLHSSTPAALFANQLATEATAQVAIGALAISLRDRLALDRVSLFRGAVRSVLNELRIDTSSVKVASDRLDQQINNVQVLINELRTQSDMLIHQDNEQRNSFQSWLQKQNGDLVDWQAKRDENLAKVLSDFNEKSSSDLVAGKQALENLQKAFGEHMKLAAPVTYWNDKRWWHMVFSWVFGALATVFFVTSITLLIEWAPTILRTVDVQDNSSYWRLAEFVAAVTVFFWIQRILVRLFFSQVHLNTDAAERVAMVKTYLALTKEGKVDEKDRSLVLGPLFRSASDGIVKDDAAPASPYDVLTKLLERK